MIGIDNLVECFEERNYIKSANSYIVSEKTQLRIKYGIYAPKVLEPIFLGSYGLFATEL